MAETTAAPVNAGVLDAEDGGEAGCRRKNISVAATATATTIPPVTHHFVATTVIARHETAWLHVAPSAAAGAAG